MRFGIELLSLHLWVIVTLCHRCHVILDCVMNLSGVNTRYILLFILVIFTGIESRSLKRRALGNNCSPESTKITVKVPTCKPRSNVPLQTCRGKCLSYSTPHDKDGSTTTVTTCRCCKAVSTYILRIQLFCQDTSSGKIVKKYHDIVSAKTCTCKPC